MLNGMAQNTVVHHGSQKTISLVMKVRATMSANTLG